MPDERTPLLAEAGPSVPTDTRVSLAGPAEELLSQIRQSPSTTPLTSLHQAKLPVYLYALHAASAHSYQARALPSDIRARLRAEERQSRLVERLLEMIKTVLDNEIHILDQLETLTQGENGGVEEEEEVEGIIWRRWHVNDSNPETVSVIDLLLLPPYTAPLLSHPLIRKVVEHSWQYGRPEQDEEGSHTSAVSRLINRFKRQITPRREHIVHIASFLVLVGLTLSIAIRPGGRIHPIEYPDRRSGAREIVYFIWAIATFLQALSSIPRSLLNLPSALTPFLAIYDPAGAFTTLGLSIHLLTLALISSTPPSLVYLNQSFIPLSVLLRHTLTRGLWAGRLLLPLVVLLFVIFTWSMNGDIFRAFYRSPSNSPLPSILANIPASNRAEPIESGIAPFETRLWLFTTAVLLLILSLIVFIARSVAPPLRDEPRWEERDQDWENDYGLLVGRQAREVFTRTARDGVASRRVVVPLNIIFLPLDILIFLRRRVARRHESGHNDVLERVRDIVWACVMGPPCAVVGLLERIG